MAAIVMSLIITLLNKERISGLGFKKYLFEFLYTSIYTLLLFIPYYYLFCCFLELQLLESLNISGIVLKGTSSLLEFLLVAIISGILLLISFYKLITGLSKIEDCCKYFGNSIAGKSYTIISIIKSTDFLH